eukprot:TRINITY_DN5686_c0_g1_i1.p2 TRINITY_DN5686_c0_g1~~TRINITY_DN5686_c0_g1_i1.p2  ORF type:complete len:145 (-),score=17.12 TRINITY_DN5686_c0_g1_i1:291-725(-)
MMSHLRFSAARMCSPATRPSLRLALMSTSTTRGKSATRAQATDKSDMFKNADVVQSVGQRLNVDQRDVKTIVDETLAVIVELVAEGNNVQLKGFGTFKRTEMAARQGRNPQTGEALSIDASARPSFSAGKNFKDTVKEEYKKKK